MSESGLSDVNGPGLDMNKDGIVNFYEFAKLAQHWQQDVPMPRISIEATINVNVDPNYVETTFQVSNDSDINPDNTIDQIWIGSSPTYNAINPFTDWNDQRQLFLPSGDS